MTTREKVLAGVWEAVCALWGLFAAVWCFVDLLPMGVGFLRIYLPAAWVSLLILCLLWLMKKPWRGLLVLALLLIVNFREMHQTKQAEKRNKVLQKDGVKGGAQ